MSVKLIIEFIYPPIPLRHHDWICYVDGEEERQRYGYGTTAIGAIKHWLTEYGEEDLRR